jgi:hypothetical protein
MGRHCMRPVGVFGLALSDNAQSGSWATGLDTQRYGLPIIRIGNDMWLYTGQS